MLEIGHRSVRLHVNNLKGAQEADYLNPIMTLSMYRSSGGCAGCAIPPRRKRLHKRGMSLA
jgi:hypothetical protein